MDFKHNISFDQSQELFTQIINGHYSNDNELELIIRAFMSRPITDQELAGAVTAFKSAMTKFPVENHSELYADIVGTGGDYANTINISTLSALVVSSMGYKIAKHGNRAVSSKTGSSDFLSQIGIKLDIEPEQASRMLGSCDFTFLFAPKYHSGFKFVADIRKKIKEKTIFNLLGPLLNPSNPPLMLIGVYNREIQNLYRDTILLLQQHQDFAQKVLIVHCDGLDEAGIHDTSYLTEIFNGIVKEYQISPEELGFEPMQLSLLAGGEPEHNKELGINILKGKGTPAQINAISINSALLLGLFNGKSLVENLQLVKEVLRTDHTYKHLTVVIATSLEIVSPQDALTSVGQNQIYLIKKQYLHPHLFDYDNSILGKIVQDKLNWLYDTIEINELYRNINFGQKFVVEPAQLRGFPELSYQYFKLQTQDHPGYILEVKRRSPSKGMIRNKFDIPQIISAYENYASIISVLTDNKYFGGSFYFIDQVKDITKIPILCKDFIISTLQIDKAQKHGADYILLMLSVLSDQGYAYLSDYAHNAGLAVLTEVSNHEELERAVKLQSKIIGINNRNLHDLTINTNKTIELITTLKTKFSDFYNSQQPIIISESGIHSFHQIQSLKAYANAFLVGSNLMSQDDIGQAVKVLTRGHNKVCGITNYEDIKLVKNAGVAYAGIILVENSPRFVGNSLQDLELDKLDNTFPKLVAVFQNSPIELIEQYKEKINMQIIQLHGDESVDYVNKLQVLRNQGLDIMKVLHFDVDNPDIEKLENDFNSYKGLVDLYLLDSKSQGKQGGTGKCFNWTLIPNYIKEVSFVGGGLNIDNFEDACKSGFKGVDFNSGVEVSPRKKSKAKIKGIFSRMRDYD